jgi:HPt (histidine-containing phosphotransfer) domain-containing protein
MIKNFDLLHKSLENDDVAAMLQEASSIYASLIKNELSELHLVEYRYTPAQAVEELGLDEELINELVADYVAQVIKSLVQFELKLKALQTSQENNTPMDYTPFRELAHKNLGVARNLRIKNAETLLYELMTKDDLEHLMLCLEALEVSTILLDAKQAYNTLKLIEVKDSFKH